LQQAGTHGIGVVLELRGVGFLVLAGLGVAALSQ